MRRVASNALLALTLAAGALLPGGRPAHAQDAAQRAQQQLNTEIQRNDALNNRSDAPPSRRAPTGSAGSAARVEGMEAQRPNFLTQQGAPIDNLKGGEFLSKPDVTNAPRLGRAGDAGLSR
ncbi:hypothetical protein [Roseomonas elaeocarpi]|uniref:Uncharacterized protein n=1 Tax=Roseomonas elaeocarpi TaxID=907779 RepID=A0ABV6JX72_9PROT